MDRFGEWLCDHVPTISMTLVAVVLAMLIA